MPAEAPVASAGRPATDVPWAGSGQADVLAAPWWLPGGQAQTLWPARLSRRHLGPAPRFHRERWTTPDGDFVDADWLLADPPGVDERPLLVLFHGLEGSSRSHYVQAFAGWARAHGWAMVLPHFRGCSGEVNLAPRAYHSGDHTEIGWMLAQARRSHRGPMLAVGVSLGGNALLRWAEEAGHSAASVVAALAAVCAPVDLTASGHALERGLNRWIYTPMFLRTMKPKALAKLVQHPGLFDRERLLAARTLFEFDDVFTGPVHGFRGAADYWQRASAKPALASIRIPTLVLNALNDPFVPAASLPRGLAGAAPVVLWQPPQGGHVGFPAGAFPADVTGMPSRVMAWLCSRLPH